MGLGPLHEALAPKAARTNRDHSLNDVKALAQWVARRIQQGADALLLVVVQDRPAHTLCAQLGLEADQQGHAQHAQQQGWQDQLPGQAGEENDRQTGGQHQNGRAQIGLAHDQRDRHDQ